MDFEHLVKNRYYIIGSTVTVHNNTSRVPSLNSFKKVFRFKCHGFDSADVVDRDVRKSTWTLSTW